jgi:general secretion pathway protein G
MRKTRWPIVILVLLVGIIFIRHYIFIKELEKYALGLPEGSYAQINPLSNKIIIYVKIENTDIASVFTQMIGVQIGANLFESSINEILRTKFYELSKENFDLYGMVVPYNFKIKPTLLGGLRYRKIKDKAKLDILNLETSIKLYKMDNGEYPDTELGLQSLIKKPDFGKIPKKWREGGYLVTEKELIDPWGREYQYRCPGKGFDFEIYTYGADGVLGGEGLNEDIFSWQIE